MYILSLKPKKKLREMHLWQVDPSVFEPLPKSGFFERHIVVNARSLVKGTLYALAFAYPLVLVITGVVFGGLVFWASFAGSMGLFWLVLKRAGYAGNFASWDIGYRKFVGLVAAFFVYAAVVYGLIYLRLWVVPIFAGVLVTTLVLSVLKSSIPRPRIPQLLEGRLNMFSGAGLAIMLGSVTLTVLTKNPSTVVVQNASVTLSLLDLQYFGIWAGVVIGLAGIFLALRPPRKIILGSAMWVALLFYLVEILPITGWNPSTISPLLFAPVFEAETGAFLSGLILVVGGLWENRITRGESGLLR